MGLDNGFGSLYSSRWIRIELHMPDGDIKVIEDLHIAITVKKTVSVEPNTADVVIYNLSEASRELIFDNAYYEPGAMPSVVTIKYDGTTVYSNILINSHSERDLSSGDWKTTLYIGDMPQLFSKKTDPEKVHKKGTPKKTVLENIVEEMGDEFKTVKLNFEGFFGGDCLENKTLARSITIEGNVEENIKKILADCFPEEDYFLFPTEDGLTITNAKQPLNGVEVYAGENLVDPPVLTEQGVNTLTLFDPGAELNGRLIVESFYFELNASGLNRQRVKQKHLAGEGNYQIMEVVHKIDNFSEDLATTAIVARSLEATVDVQEY